MPKRKKKCPYEDVTSKIDIIDQKLLQTKTELEDLTRRMSENPDICPDVEDSEKALKEVLSNILIEELLKKKPVGDA